MDASLSRVMLPDVEDLLNLNGRFGWLVLFFDQILIPDFENIFQQDPSHGSYGRLYGCYRESLESGWRARPTPRHLRDPHEHISAHLKTLIDERVVSFVTFDRDRDLKSIATLRNIYGRMIEFGEREWLPEEEKWLPIIQQQAHTIGRVTFSKDGDIMLAAIQGEGKDLQQQVLIRQKADELRSPIASAQNSLFLVPIGEDTNYIPQKRIESVAVDLVTKLHLALPSFTSVPNDEWLAIREKYYDLLVPARRHLQRLAFSFAKDFRHDSEAEVKAWAAAYVQNVILPDIEALRLAIRGDRSKLGRRVLGAIVDFIPTLFGVLDWKNILVSSLKATLTTREAFDSSTTPPSEITDRSAFVKLLAKATKSI